MNDPIRTVLSDSFAQESRAVVSPGKRAASPFCLRLTPEERARLQAEAGSQPLGAYIRARLLGDRAEKRRKSRQPRVDDQTLAQVLAELGRSRLASNMNQIARSAHIGALPVTPELEDDLRAACEAIITMRDMLIAALGVKPVDGA